MLEAGIKGEVATKKKTQDEKSEKRKQLKKVMESQKKKDIIRKTMETDEDLFKLKDLIESGNLDDQTIEIAKKLDLGNEINTEEIKEIFDKIDQIENMDDVDKYLPKGARITKDEYKKALNDDIFRIQMITKINTALTIIANQINPNSGPSINLFSGFLTILDKNLVTIQETHIDIKDSLEDLTEDLENNKLSLWQKFLKLLKEIFS